jgi:hypothetical protein
MFHLLSPAWAQQMKDISVPVSYVGADGYDDLIGVLKVNDRIKTLGLFQGYPRASTINMRRT